METNAPQQVVCYLPDTLGLGLSLLPSMEFVRARYPQVSLSALAEDRCRFDEAARKDFDGWTELPQSLPGRIAAAWRIRSQSPDLLIHPTAPALLWRAIGAARRIELTTGQQIVSPLATPRTPAWRALAASLVSVGLADETCASPSLQGTAQRIRSLRRATHLTGRFFVMHSDSCGGSSLEWTPEEFGKVARSLGERYQIPSLVVWWGEHGRRRAERVAANAGGHALVAPAMALSDVGECLLQSELALSCDGDLLDVAVHQGTVAIHPLPANEFAAATLFDHASPEQVAQRCAPLLLRTRVAGFTAVPPRGRRRVSPPSVW